MTRVTFLAALLALVVNTFAAQANSVPAGTYKLDPTHSSLTFKLNHMGLSNYTARFAKFDATLEIDPAKPEAAKLNVTVDPRSVRTDFPFPEQENFDKKLGEDANFFQANQHGAITFVTTGIKTTGEKTADITGNLTLRGVTKPVTLSATLNGAMMHPMLKKPAMGFSAIGTVKRSEFGMTYLLPFIGDDVQIIVEAELIGG